MAYDEQNVFAKILRGDIPCSRIYDDAYAIAFHDLSPQAPIHLLVIPKGTYTSFDDFIGRATTDDISGFFRAVREVAHQMDLSATGYRLITNNGRDAHQEIPHFHIHLMGGAPLGPLLAEEAQ